MDDNEKEFKRWNSYASALLIAIPIILGVTSFGKLADSSVVAFPVISIIAGLVAVLCTVLWFTGESDWHVKVQAQGEEKPGLLFIASGCFGFQISSLLGAFLIYYFSNIAAVVSSISMPVIFFLIAYLMTKKKVQTK